VNKECLRFVCLRVVRREKFLPKLYKIYRSAVSCRRAGVKNNEKLRTTDELGYKKRNMLVSDKARFTFK
jgi:hypothetical protein